MSTNTDLPELPDSQLASDDGAAFDELAHRAGRRCVARRPKTGCAPSPPGSETGE